MYSKLHEMVLRADRPTDASTLRRLAALDSARPLSGPTLLAEVDGRPVAAIGLDDHRVVADPFEQTADVVELLKVRAERMEPADASRAGLFHRRRAAAA